MVDDTIAIAIVVAVFLYFTGMLPQQITDNINSFVSSLSISSFNLDSISNINPTLMLVALIIGLIIVAKLLWKHDRRSSFEDLLKNLNR